LFIQSRSDGPSGPSVSDWFRYTHLVTYAIEFEQEDDGRWIAEIPALPGVMSYGATKREAESKVEALALRVIAG